LARADLLNTNDIMSIQALIIYLFVSRGVESSRYVWAMLGLALRLAVALGLHRDGSNFPDTISPFDAELRRRTWWNLCFADSMSGMEEVTELMITDKLFDTKLPSNINDSDIWPKMTASPTPREGTTEMTPLIARAEFWKLGMQLGSSLSSLFVERGDQVTGMQDQLDLATAARKRVTDKFFPNLTPVSPPLHRFLFGVMTSVFTKLTMIVTYRMTLARYHKTRSIPPDESRQIVGLGLSLFDRMEALKAEPDFRGYTWHLRGGQGVQWHALCILLSQLCSQPWSAEMDEVYARVKVQMDQIPEQAKTHSLFPPVSQLMSRATKRHERYQTGLLSQTKVQQQQQTAVPFEPAPDFVGVGALSPSATAAWIPSPLRELNAPVDFAAMGVSLDPRAIASVDGLMFSDAVALTTDLPDADMMDSTSWDQWDELIANMMGSQNSSAGAPFSL
jgi:hypothetical protein